MDTDQKNKEKWAVAQKGRREMGNINSIVHLLVAQALAGFETTPADERADGDLQVVFAGLETPIQEALAEQQAEQQKYQLDQAKVRAEQDRVQAEGQANALKAQAGGEAEAIRIRAEAQAQANLLLAKSLTPELIRYQQLQRWDGRLPVFQGGGTTPLVNVSDLISGTIGQ